MTLGIFSDELRHQLFELDPAALIRGQDQKNDLRRQPGDILELLEEWTSVVHHRDGILSQARSPCPGAQIEALDELLLIPEV